MFAAMVLLAAVVLQNRSVLISVDRRGTIKPLQCGEFAMPLRRGEVQGYDFNRMVVKFTTINQDK
jgi:hypothetical protein